MDPKDLRKQLEQTVNSVVDQRLEGKAPKAAPATPKPAPKAPAPVAAEAPTETPAAVAPSAPAAGAQPEGAPKRGKIVYIKNLRDVPQGEIAVWGANMQNYDTGTPTPGAGQAEAAAGRAEWIGIPTKRTASTFLGDADLKDPQFSQLMNAQLMKIEAALKEGKTVYFPVDGIGTGRAQLATKAPEVYRRLIGRLDQMGIRNDGQDAGSTQVKDENGQVLYESGATVGADELRDRAARSKGLDVEFRAETATSPVSPQGGLPVPPQGETPASVAPRAISGGSGIIFETSKSTSYPARTIENVRSADLTIQLAYDYNSIGEKLTTKTIRELGKPSVRVDLNQPLDVKSIADQVAKIAAGRPVKINIAGNGIYTVKDKIDQAGFDSILEQILSEVMKTTEVSEVRSGGQTGADEAGVKAAAKLGIPARVLAPGGYKFRDITGRDISDEAAFKARFQVATGPENQPGVVQTPPQGETPVSVAPRAISGGITTTAEAMNAGLRTSTTRAAAWKVGDYLDFSQDGVNGFWKIKEVKKYDFNNPDDVAAWESTEGWNFERIKEQGGVLLTQLTKPNSRTFILEKVDSLPEGAKAIKQGMYYKYGPDGKTFDPSFTKLAGSAPEKMTTAATPDLEAQLAATQTGEMRTPISALPTGEGARTARAEAILGYDPMATLEQIQGERNMSDTQKNLQRRLLADVIDYMNQAGLYTTTRVENLVTEIANSRLIFDEETSTYQVKGNRELQLILDDVNKLHAQAMTEFLNKPHGLDRKVYQLYIDHIFDKETKPGKRVSAKDIEADGATIERGRRAIRRYALHFLMNRIPGSDEGTWREARDAFRQTMIDAGIPEDVFDGAMRQPLYGQKDERSMLNDRKVVEAATTDLRRAAGALLRDGVLYDATGHQDVAQPIYYLLDQIAAADAEIMSGEAGNTNVFAEEDFIRKEAADLSEIQDEIDRIRQEFGIEESPTREIGGALGRSREGTVGQEFTLRDLRNYKMGGQRRYVLDMAGVVDPRWVEVDEKGLDLEIFANDNHPDGTRTSASIGFNVSTDPTARVYTSQGLGERSSTLEIRVTKAIKEFITERDFGSRLHPTTSDKTIRLATEIPYTRDRYRVMDVASKLRGAISSGKIVIVAFPQFDTDTGKTITYPDGDVVAVDGRVFIRNGQQMVALEEGDSAIPKLIEAGASVTKPFRLGDPAEYPSGQVRPGQFNKFVVDVDPVVHQAVQHTLPLHTPGGYEYQGAYIPESFQEEFNDGEAVVEFGPKGQERSGAIRPATVVSGKMQTKVVDGKVVRAMVPTEKQVLKLPQKTPEIRTLILPDDLGNYPTVGTMIDGYVFGDPYGEDPQMYAEIADRTGPSLKSLVSQRRRYEEMIEAGTPARDMPPLDEENMTLLEENITPNNRKYGVSQLNSDIVGGIPDTSGVEKYEGTDVYDRMKDLQSGMTRVGQGPAGSQFAAAIGQYEANLAEYQKYLAMKEDAEKNPTDTEKMRRFKLRYPEDMQPPKPPKEEKFKDLEEGPRVAVYDGTDVYDRAAKKPGRRKATARVRGPILEMPPVSRAELSPAHRQHVDTMLRSLLIILRNRAQTANFIGGGGLNGDMTTIQSTTEPISKLLTNLEQNGLVTRYFESILHEDVFATRLGLDNPDASVWMQKLSELPAQKPLSTRGRDTGRFLPRSVLTGDTESDAFNDAVDSIYEAVADFHAQNPARMKGDISFEGMQESTRAELEAAGVSASPEEILAERQGPEYAAIRLVAKKLDKNRGLIATMLADPTAQQYMNGDIYALAEMAPPPGYDGGEPWGDFVMKNVDEVVRMIRNNQNLTKRKGIAETRADVTQARTVAIRDAVGRLAKLPREDWKRAVDTAFEKYARHLSEDMDGDSMVKVINSVLYADQQENALAAFIEEYQYHDATDALGMEVLPDLHGKTSRLITKEELLQLSKNKSTVRKLAAFVKKNGFDFVATTSPEGGTRVLITKVEKDKWGNFDVAEESRFSRSNLFTADEVNRVLQNFGATGLIKVTDSGLNDGNSPLLKITINADALDYVGNVDQKYVDETTGRLTTTLRNLLDSGMKAEFRRLVNEEAIRAKIGPVFQGAELAPLAIWEADSKDGFYGPFGQRRVRNQGTETWWLLRRGGTDAAERLAAIAGAAESVKPGADPILDALRAEGDTRAKQPLLDRETEGLSRVAKSYLRNHKMKLIGGGGLLGAIAMGVGVDAALNKAEYGDQAAQDMLPASVAMNAAFEASPLLGSALALSHSAVNKQDMMRTLVNILGSLAGGAAGGALGAFAGGVGAFAGGTAGSMAGAGLTNALYNAVTGQTDYDSQPMPANVAVDNGSMAGAGSVRARVMPAVTRNETAIDQIRQLENLGG